MLNLGDKILRFRRTEDIMSAYVVEVTDVFEVAPNETYYEITERDLNTHIECENKCENIF